MEARLKGPAHVPNSRDSRGSQVERKKSNKRNWTNLKEKLITLKTVKSGALKLLKNFSCFELIISYISLIIKGLIIIMRSPPYKTLSIKNK